MEYIKFYSVVPNAFTVTSGTTWSGVDEDYMIDDWNVWSGTEETFPLQEIVSYLCIQNPLPTNGMTEQEIEDYTTYSGGE
jgi:hypothetical protein